jgi:cytochrome c5
MTARHCLGFSLGASAFLILLLAGVQAQTTAPTQKSSPTPAAKQQAATHTTQPSQSEGERIFAQNCSRCHNAPEGFSPSISGTIVRHMRVRAQLSGHDEQELLHFLNP